MAMAVNPEIYPSRNLMRTEAHYNSFRPWRWAWVVAILAMVALSISLVKDNKLFGRIGMGLFLVSFFVQIYGFILRVVIAGRPPVTNMFESVIWVGFGTMVFGLIIEMIYRKRVVALCSLGFAALCLILSDVSTTVLDRSIHPLEPVLRSNFWLLIHVLTITISYSAFAISLAVGNMALAPFVFLGRESKIFPLKDMALYAYRSVQVGVFLLGAGTILGGVWADYSWGRFWGWDPKETWALIAFLGYVAIIHARFRGMLREFGFLAACIIAFLLVVMAWYGVNFVLGAGLHSYGFSSGGNTEMFIYCAVQCAFVGYAIFLRNRALRAK
jgi:cytochrome c-type biogenesis protein CcsB